MKILGEESIILTSQEYLIYKQSELSQISSYIYNISNSLKTGLSSEIKVKKWEHINYFKIFESVFHLWVKYQPSII